jgi:hypothetical protein
MERILRENPQKLTLEERDSLLIEPVEYINSALELRENPESPLSKVDVFLFAILLTFGFSSLAVASVFLMSAEVGGVFLFALVILLIVTVFFFDRFSTNRFLSRITPRFAACVSVLRPSQEELDMLFTRGWKILKIMNRSHFEKKLFYKMKKFR